MSLLAVHAGKTHCNGGLAPMQAFLKKARVDTKVVAQSDGRGGGVGDRTSPVAVTQILHYWITQPDFALFRDCLPILDANNDVGAIAAALWTAANP